MLWGSIEALLCNIEETVVSDLPIRDRPYQLFVSYSHKDSAAVSGLVRWLEKIARVHVWWDEHGLSASSTIVTQLPEAIGQSRGALFVISESSARSGWVKEEYGAALNQRTRHPEYRLIAVRLDATEPPDFLRTTKWVDIPQGTLETESAFELLSGLYPEQTGPLRGIKDIYVSRSWRAAEAEPADSLCRHFIRAGLRLIGDTTDHQIFDPEVRIKSIMSSCGAAVAMAPNRGGKTSQYIEQEILVAAQQGIPYAIVADDDIEFTEHLVRGALDSRTFPLSETATKPEIARALIDIIRENYRVPSKPHYAFYGCSLTRNAATTETVRRLIERVTGIECVLGVELAGQHAQKEIIDLISDALFMLADISDDNNNTMIEAGVARGAGTRLHLLARGEPKPTRFMFRDLEVSFYSNDVEMLGIVHRIAYSYRRRVLNREIAETEWFGA